MKKHIIASVKVVIGFFLFYTFMFHSSHSVIIPLSFLCTSFPIKVQEAFVAWKFSLGLSALAFPAPSRGRMPARQEGVFTKRLSDKQCIMKAASLLEHKGVFLVFVSPDANIFVYSVFNINLCVFAALRSKNKIFYSLSQFS